MKPSIKLIFVFAALALLWPLLEIAIYGYRQPRIVDDIMVCAYGWAMAYSYQTGKESK